MARHQYHRAMDGELENHDSLPFDRAIRSHHMEGLKISPFNTQVRGQEINAIEIINKSLKIRSGSSTCSVMNSDGLSATVRRISIKSKEMKSVFPLPLFCKETLHFDQIR
jgi:hypothetical protein